MVKNICSKIPKKTIIICVVILVVISSILVSRGVFPVRDEEEKDGRFDFYIYTITEDNLIIPFPPALMDQVLLDQPPFIYFECLKNAYLYLLLFSPENKKMTVLFPGPERNFPGNYQFTRYFLPKGANWEPYLQSPGQYTLYFIISTSRMKTVEQLLDRYTGCSKSGQKDNDQSVIIAALQAEIEKYKREKEWIKNISSIPEWIGGTVRSNEEEVIYRSWSVPFRGIVTHSVSFHYNTGENDE